MAKKQTESFDDFAIEDYQKIIDENDDLKATNRRILKSLENLVDLDKNSRDNDVQTNIYDFYLEDISQALPPLKDHNTRSD